MNELRPREMTKEELEKILDEYREENVKLKLNLEASNRRLEEVFEQDEVYRKTIEHLSCALKNLSEAIA